MMPASRLKTSRRRGYTLMEVLVASLLTGVLLATLWGIFQIYLRLFETGERISHQAQLQQSLADQLSRDLSCVAALAAVPQTSGEAPILPGTDDPWTDPSSPAGDQDFDLDWLADRVMPADSPLLSGPLPRSPSIGLQGTAQSLRIVGLQWVPELDALRPELAAEPLAHPLQHQRRADELRVVHYRWVNPPDAAELETTDYQYSDYQYLVGLLREEMSWEDQADGPGALDALDALAPLDAFVATPRDTAPYADATTLRRDLFHEVQGIRFRYFDGHTWRNSWNTEMYGRLPVAIEVYLLLARPGAAPPSLTEDQPDLLDDPRSLGELTQTELLQQDVDQLQLAAQDSHESGLYRLLFTWSGHHVRREVPEVSGADSPALPPSATGGPLP